MLTGFALENLIKANLIGDNPDLIKEGKLDKSIGSHNIIRLCEMIKDFELKVPEHDLLELLKEAIPYWGRYPIPKNHTQINDEKYLIESDHHTFLSLFERLQLRLLKRTSSNWLDVNGNKTDWDTHNYDRT